MAIIFLTRLTPDRQGSAAAQAASTTAGVLLGVKPAGNDSPAKRRYTFYASQGITETFVSGSLLSMFGTFSNLSPYMVNATFKFRIFAGSKR